MGILEIGGVSIVVAFIAGLLSVASPCVLPLVPAYLGYLTGAAAVAAPEPAGAGQGYRQPAVSRAGGTALAVAPGPGSSSTPSPFLHSIAFVSGFTAVFVTFGISVGVAGYFLRDQQDLILKVAGSILIVLGLHLAGVINIPFLEQERRLDVGSRSKVGYARSFLIGSTFSAGWSPCIGPTLGAIFALAVSTGTAAQAGLLLLVYSLGLSVPFILMGLAYNTVQPFYARIKRYVWIVNYLSGALLIVIGILIFTNSLINLNDTFNIGILDRISGVEEQLAE
jgi:cytochrome c-type biogenesis protein